MAKTIFPCKNCSNRNVECHVKCEKYKDAQTENIQRKMEKYKSSISGYTGLDFARHFDRMQGKYHGKVFKSVKK